MKKPKRMDQIKIIIETYLATQSVKATARQLNMARNTVRQYLRRGEAHPEGLSGLGALDDQQLAAFFYTEPSIQEQDRGVLFGHQVTHWLQELRKPGVTRMLLWQEYRVQHPSGYGYSQFCERLKKEVARRDLTIALHHPGGETMMVDFAGKKMQWVDRHSGEVHDCEVLVAVFPHSHCSFAIALPSQRLHDFVHGLNEALCFFGAVPKVILSDNLRSYVSYADRYEPRFTQLCEQLAAHYQVDLAATRVGKARDKASVENAVGLTYKRIYAPLRNEVFHSLEELNSAIYTQIQTHNSLPYQKKEGNRKEIFDRFERPVMRDLPSELFEIRKITRAKVQRNYHVFLGEDKHFYSVHYDYVGSRAEVIYTATMVEIFINGRRVAVHKRLTGSTQYVYQTQQAHMPEKHKRWMQIKGYDAQYFLRQADQIGPATHWAIQHILLSRIHEPQSYNSCLGVLRLANKYSPKRLEQAADRCRPLQKVTYSMLKRILEHQLDQAPAPASEQLRLPFHDNLRGPDDYQ